MLNAHLYFNLPCRSESANLKGQIRTLEANLQSAKTNITKQEDEIKSKSDEIERSKAEIEEKIQTANKVNATDLCDFKF